MAAIHSRCMYSRLLPLAHLALSPQMKIRACARHFVLHNGAFLFLRAAIANAASTRSSSSADADLMLRLLDLLSVVMSFAAVINEQKEHEEEGEEGEEGEARVEDDDDSVDEGDDEDDKESGQGIDDSENESGNGHGHVRVGTDMSVAAKRRKIATVPAGAAAVTRRGGVFNIRHECFLTALCVQSVARSCCPSSQGGSCRGALAAAFVDVLWRAHLIAHDDCSMGAAATTDVIASADIGIPLLLNSLALLRSHFPDPSAVIRMHKTKHSLDYRNGGGGGGDERKRTIADNKAASSTSTLSSMLTLAILTATAIIAPPPSSAKTLSENGKRTATAEEEKEGVACRWTVDVVSAAAEMSAHNETLCRSNIDDGGGGGGGFMLLLSQCRDATTRALLRCALNHKHGGDNLLVELPTLLLCHAESRHGNCNFNNSDVVDSSYAHATGTMLTDKERLGALLSQERTQHEVSATVASACVLAVLKYRREGAKLVALTRLRMKSSPALDGGRGLGDGNEGVENEHGNNEEEEDDSAEWAIRSVCSRLGVEYGFDSSRPADVCRSGGGGGSAGVARQISCDSFVNDIVTQLRVIATRDARCVDGGDGMRGGEMYDDIAAQGGGGSSFAEVLAEGALGLGGWVEH
mmetsp:Transcript_14771/g.30352  ORF Transcript_14771/g.30352 Transcript_14771/m.30352 type:complete len:637 (+) Transcript_14771:115-2025(+)